MTNANKAEPSELLDTYGKGRRYCLKELVDMKFKPRMIRTLDGRGLPPISAYAVDSLTGKKLRIPR